MGSRVTQNPWLPSVHFDLAVYQGLKAEASQGDGIVWLCNGEPTLDWALLKSNGLISRAPETLLLKSVVILTMKHHNSSIHTSQEVSLGAHWL
jgi:hypothetical protein